MLDALARDLKFALRSIGRAPAFTLAAVLTLALGIGANTAMFSFADATAWRPPDVPASHQIVRVFTSSKDIPLGEMSYPDYLDLRARTSTVTGLVAYETGDFALARGRDEPARYLGGWIVSANFFLVLGVEPVIGRTFRPEEETRESLVAVISHRVWERDFQGAPDIVGQRVLLSGAPFTVIGVTSQEFTGTELYFHPEIFIPLSAVRRVTPALSADVLENRSTRFLTVLGRLRPEATSGQAASEFATVARNLQWEHPATNDDRTSVVLPEVTARARLDSGGAQGAVIILVLVGLVLLLACANVANLVLSKSLVRARDLALRAAMGATRARLISQMLIENLVLAAAGGAMALIVAGWALAYLSRVLIIPSALPLSIDLRLDARVLAFAAVTTIVAAMLFGLPPALKAARLSLNAVLRQRPDASAPRFTLRDALVVLQVAISVLVLVSAGLMIRASIAARGVDPGFRRDRVLLASFNPGLSQLDAAASRQYYERLVSRVQTQAGVAAVGLTRYVPLGVTGGSIGIAIDGSSLPDEPERIQVAESVVDPGYWDVMRVPIVRGRRFDRTDTATSPRIAIVNETMAARYWGGADPIGKTIRMPDVPGPDGGEPLVLEIVGVAKDGKYTQLAEAPQPFVYRPFSQVLPGRMTMVVLAAEDVAPLSLASVLRRIAQEVDAEVPLFDVRTLDDLYASRALLPSRVTSRMVSALGMLALSLAGVGLYGVITFLYSRRTHEIGIRIAVGATPARVLRMVVAHTATLVTPGLVLGTGAATVLTPLLASPAFDFVVPGDPAVFVGALLVVALIGLAAAIRPAVRAARVDPTSALRQE